MSEITHPNPETAQLVTELARTKTEEQVARKIGMPLPLFRSHYATDYQTGQDEAESELMQKLLAQGIAGNANAAWKWMSRKGLVVNRPRQVEVTGKNGGPVQFIDLSRLNEEQLDEYGRLAAIAEGLDPDALLREPIGNA